MSKDVTTKRGRGRPKKEGKKRIKKPEYGKVDISHGKMMAVMGDKAIKPHKGSTKLGRPTKYKPEYCEKLIEHMGKGYSFESFASECHTGREMLYLWSQKHKDFSNAKKIGTERCRIWWEKIGVAGMIGKYPGFQASIWIFNMKNRFKWTDKTEIEIETRYKEDLKKIDKMSAEEILTLAKEATEFIEGEVLEDES